MEIQKKKRTMALKMKRIVMYQEMEIWKKYLRMIPKYACLDFSAHYFVVRRPKDAWITILLFHASFHLRSRGFFNRLIVDYATHIISASNSLISLSIKSGKQSGTSLIFIFPNFKSLRAFSFVSS